MSTILKALKRLDEQKRSAAAPRTLEEQVIGAGAPRSRDPDAGRNKWLFAGGGFAAVLLAAGAGWVLNRERAPEPAAAPAASVAAAPTPSSPAAEPLRSAAPSEGRPITGTVLENRVREGLAVPSARAELAPHRAVPRADQPEAEAAPAAVVERADLAASPRGAAPPLVAQIPRDAGMPERASRAPAAGARQGAATGTSLTLPVERVAAARAAAQPPAEVESVAAGDPAEHEPPAPAPKPEEPPSANALAAPAPAVGVDRTQWHPTPEKRSAMIRIGEEAARELREGDAVNGVVVKEIRPSGVVFLHRGEEFVRRVGSSP